MPDAPKRFCAAPRCSRRVQTGYCDQHRRASTAHQRPQGAHGQGYTRRWESFRRVTFPGLLADVGKLPICGARLAEGPSPHSQCAAEGRIEGTSLHLDHDPPLAASERQHEAIVCDPHRVAFLCHRCHSVKTRREMGR